ncbi:MAG TPA: beta-propeller domain-containing protein [Polyangiaceae bacterium]|nr:beta-propeller domain-containing protein [Polyangiaceae bacterium]
MCLCDFLQRIASVNDGLLALPITVCDGGGNGTYGINLSFAGLMAFDISLETGITEHGRLPFLDLTATVTGENCSKWWTDAGSLVKRSIFMDDWVYGLSDAQLRVASLANMSQPSAILKLVK